MAAAAVNDNGNGQGVAAVAFGEHPDDAEIAAIDDGVIGADTRADYNRKMTAMRRVCAEFETLLERAQERKESMVSIDEKIAAVDDERNRKEDKLKELERQLVELLVEQQKKLLEVLSAFNSTLKKNKKKHGARRKKAIARANAAAAKGEGRKLC